MALNSTFPFWSYTTFHVTLKDKRKGWDFHNIKLCEVEWVCRKIGYEGKVTGRLDSIRSLCWFELLIIGYADADLNLNLYVNCMMSARPRLKLNQMTPGRDIANATLSKIWPQPSLQHVQTLDAWGLNPTGRGEGGGRCASRC